MQLLGTYCQFYKINNVILSFFNRIVFFSKRRENFIKSSSHRRRDHSYKKHCQKVKKPFFQLGVNLEASSAFRPKPKLSARLPFSRLVNFPALHIFDNSMNLYNIIRDKEQVRLSLMLWLFAKKPS